MFITSSASIFVNKDSSFSRGVVKNRYKLGLTPEEILNRIGHPTLTLAQIYAGLTYYHANREEIEADIAAEEESGKIV
ncbi:hypothetical protein [Scytonema sp. PCC 10023]|uniref:DUF433 domain-containing protein n=1 Tax=Scytonema sp. PCC 10023 TaxID=1680591 RepID=UPI0039C5D032